MFPQNAEVHATLGAMRQAEIRAECARYRLLRQARAAQPSRRPRWLAALPRPWRAWKWALLQGRTARPTPVAAGAGCVARDT
jgi:hypothetical protein